MTPDSRHSLRRRLRAVRRAISPSERARAARQAARHLAAAGLVRPGSRIAAYLPLPEEFDCDALVRLALARGAGVWLPRIVSLRAGRMRLQPFQAPRRRNRFGIDEPVGGAPAAFASMRIVFLPVVGFDASGTRLGMGGGFYDRALAFRRRRRRWHGPLLVGVAYAAQEVDVLGRLDTDIGLDAILTEQGLRRFSGTTT